jgi:pimeloyl-ACP methyl ester carboxylesterase
MYQPDALPRRPAVGVELVAGADVELGHVVAGGWRLRTRITTPAGAAPPSTAVLYLPGLGGASGELSSDPEEPLRLLLEGWTRAGLLTLRLSLRGAGDSEGPTYQETDLFTEIAGYRAALQALARRPGITRVVLFGYSVGGMIAPLLAGEGAGVAAVVVFGTSLLRWHDCLIAGARRQQELAGLGGEPLTRSLSAWGELLHRVLREGATPGEVLADSPHLAWLEGSVCHGETLHGRHIAFFQQLERLDLPALWRTVACPALVLHGEHDWVCAPDEGRAVAEAAGGPYVELPGVGHDLRRHESLARSFADPGAGRWDGSVVSAMIRWIEAG